MSKPLKKQFVRKPYVPSTFNKSYIPMKNTDSNQVHKIFAIVQDGDYNKIKNFISENHVTFKVENERGENLLHIILNNQKSDFEEEDKFELVNYFIDHGTFINGPNKNNVTPLHLACKYQYVSIVKLLLEKGADATATDNQNMTPIHYAIQGNLTDCKKPKKIKALIPDEGIRKKTPLNELRNATAIIIDILYAKSFKGYMLHIRKTLKNIKNIYPDFFNEIRNKILTETSTVLSGGLSGGTIEHKTAFENINNLKSKIESITNSIYDNIQDKLSKSTSNIDIKMNQVDGWGPSDKNIEKILPYDTLKTIFTKMETDVNNNVINTNEHLIKIIDVCKNTGDNIYNKINTAHQIIYEIVQINKFLSTNNKINGKKKNIYIPESDFASLLWHETTDKLLYQELDIKDPKTGKSLSPGKDDDLNFFIIKKFDYLVKLIRGTKDEIAHWRKARRVPEKLPLTNDKNIVKVGYNAADANITSTTSTTTPPITTVNDLLPIISFKNAPYKFAYGTAYYNDKPFLFITKIVFASLQIKKHMTILSYNTYTLINNFKNKYYYEIYHRLISNILTTFFNIIQNMRLILTEKTFILSKSTSLINNYKNILSKHKTHPYIFAVEANYDRAIKLHEYLEAIFSDFDTMYNNIKTFHKILNDSIENLNSISSINFIKNYFFEDNIGLVSKPLAYGNIADNTTNELKKIYDKPFLKLKDIPNNLNDYVEKYSGFTDDTLEKMRRTILENYFPTIDIHNYPTYYSEFPFGTTVPNLKKFILSNALKYKKKQIATPTAPSGGATEILPRIGYLIENIKIDPAILPNGAVTEDDDYVNNAGTSTIINGITITDGQITDPLPRLAFGKTGIGGKLNDAIDSTNTSAAEKDRHIGIIGFSTKKPKRKRSEPAFDSISNFLDDHLEIMKQYIIRNVIGLFKDIKSKGDPDSTVQIISNDIINDKLRKNIKTVKDNILRLVGSDYGINPEEEEKEKKNAILYTIIGKITDQIIQELIDSSIKLSATKFSNDVIHKQYLAEDYSQLGGMNTLLNIDTGFKVNFNKLFDEIVNDFFDNVNENLDDRYDRLKYTNKLIQDEEPLPEEYKIYDPNYKSATKVIEQCYKIKPELIDHLVKHMGNINAKDYVQATPIFYAIELLNQDLVKKLIDLGSSVYVDSVENNVGVTPFKHILNLYEQHNNYVYDIDGSPTKILENLYKPTYKKIKDYIQSKKQYKNNIITYMDTIFPQLLVMYNNMFYIHASNYLHNWSYDKSQKLIKLLKDYNIINNNQMFNNKIPLLDIDYIGAIKKNSNLNALSVKENKLEKSIKSLENQIKDRTNKKTSLEKELTYYTGLVVIDNTTTKYKAQLKAKIDALTDQINKLDVEKIKLTDNKTKLTTNLTSRSTYINVTLKAEISTFLGTSYHTNARNVARLYDNIFKKVINSTITGTTDREGHDDFGLYNQLWDQYTKDNNRMKNVTNIHVVCLIVQSKIINKLKQPNMQGALNKLNDDLAVLKDLYNDIFKYIIKNMDMLPQKMNYENVFLKDTMDIIIHCAKHVIFSNLYYAILRSVAEYAKSLNPKDIKIPESDPLNPYNVFKDVDDGNNDAMKETRESLNIYGDNKDYAEYIGKIVDNVVQYDYSPGNNKNKRTKLKDYIIDVMPKMTVKYILDKYDDDNDENRKIESIDQIFEEILTLLKENPVLPVSSESSLIKNLDDFVLPYYKDIAEQVIKSMENVINNYNRFIMNESRYINVINLINTQVIKEKSHTTN